MCVHARVCEHNMCTPQYVVCTIILWGSYYHDNNLCYSTCTPLRVDFVDSSDLHVIYVLYLYIVKYFCILKLAAIFLITV